MELVQVAQHVDNLTRGTSFYQALLGEPPVATFEQPGLVFFRVGSVRLLLDTVAPSAFLYFAVDDIEASIRRLEGAGGIIDTPPHLIFHHDDDTLGPSGADEWQAFVRDTEGNLVGLVSQVHQPGAGISRTP